MRADTLYKTIREEPAVQVSHLLVNGYAPVRNVLVTTLTISLFLLLFLEVSVLVKVEVYLLTDTISEIKLEIIYRVHRAILTLCVLDMMSARSSQSCRAISFHALPSYEWKLTQVRTTYTSPHELRCICRTILSG